MPRIVSDSTGSFRAKLNCPQMPHIQNAEKLKWYIEKAEILK